MELIRKQAQVFQINKHATFDLYISLLFVLHSYKKANVIEQAKTIASYTSTLIIL